MLKRLVPVALATLAITFSVEREQTINAAVSAPLPQR